MNILSKCSMKKWCAVVVMTGFSACSSFSPTPHLAQGKTDDFADPEIPSEVKFITPALVKLQQEQRDHQVGQDIKNLVASAAPYAIDSGDVLSIVVWGHPELAAPVMTVQSPAMSSAELAAPVAAPTGFVVDHDGMLQFPFAGKLKISGLTEEQARDLIARKIGHYINKPNVTLRVQAYRSKRIYVDGEVKAPGLQSITDIPMTLVEGLNRAGGMLPTADQSQITIIRNGTRYPISLPQMVQSGVDPASIMLRHGDLVRVLSRDESKVFVAGEVTAPKALTMHNGRLTLNEALGESGGINPVTGDSRRIYVVRKSSKEPMVFQLDAGSPGAMAVAERFELNPKDLVYVAATRLTNWHRTISLIFPSALSSAVGVGKQ